MKRENYHDCVTRAQPFYLGLSCQRSQLLPSSTKLHIIPALAVVSEHHDVGVISHDNPQKLNDVASEVSDFHNDMIDAEAGNRA